jgi:hypothetical protein
MVRCLVQHRDNFTVPYLVLLAQDFLCPPPPPNHSFTTFACLRHDAEPVVVVGCICFPPQCPLPFVHTELHVLKFLSCLSKWELYLPSLISRNIFVGGNIPLLYIRGNSWVKGGRSLALTTDVLLVMRRHIAWRLTSTPPKLSRKVELRKEVAFTRDWIQFVQLNDVCSCCVSQVVWCLQAGYENALEFDTAVRHTRDGRTPASLCRARWCIDVRIPAGFPKCWS